MASGKKRSFFTWASFTASLPSLAAVIRLIFCCYFRAQRANQVREWKSWKMSWFSSSLIFASLIFTCESRGHSSHTQHGWLADSMWFQVSKSSGLIIPMSFTKMLLFLIFAFLPSTSPPSYIIYHVPVMLRNISLTSNKLAILLFQFICK